VLLLLHFVWYCVALRCCTHQSTHWDLGASG
jgi:hypothetical protein